MKGVKKRSQKQKVTEKDSSTSSLSQVYPRKAPKRQAKKKSTEEKGSSSSSVSPRKASKRQAKKSTEGKDSSTSSVSPRKAPKRQATKKSTEEKDSSTGTSSVSPRKAPKRQATKKSTEGKDSSTSSVSPRKAQKRQAKEMSTADNSESSSKSPKKAAAERQSSTKAAKKTNGQAETSMEKSKTRKAPGNSKAKQGGGDGPGSKSCTLPPIYPDEDVTISERMQMYGEEILVDCMYCEVESGFEFYLDENVRRKGWKAVWRSRDLHCDVLVKVKNAHRFPDAEVELVEPLCAEPNSLGGPGGDGQQLKTKEVQKFLKAKTNRVPLMELYPVCDEDVEEKTWKGGEDRESDEESEFGDMEETAKILEYYRFFYTYVWRVMDEFQQSGGYFVCGDLRPRLAMYYDVKNKKVSDSIGKLYTDTMKEYQEVNRAFQAKRSDPDAKDEANKLWAKVGKLYELLNKLDDPSTRDKCQMRAKKTQVTHLVADKFTPELIESANLDKGTTTKQHKTLASALKSSFNLDTILIFPGRYSGKGFEEISKDIVIKGAGKSPSDVVITCQQKALACVESTAFDLNISNVTFEGLPPSAPHCKAALLVSHGKVQVSNCIFKSFAGGIHAAESSQLKVDKCEIYDIAGSAIVGEIYCKLVMSNTHIHHCGGFTTSGGQPKKKKTASKRPECSKAGVFIQGRHQGRSPFQTNVNMNDNKIEYTGGPGVWLQVLGYSEEMSYGLGGDEPETKAYTNMEDFDMAAIMAGVDWFSMKYEFKENVGGNAFLELVEGDYY